MNIDAKLNECGIFDKSFDDGFRIHMDNITGKICGYLVTPTGKYIRPTYEDGLYKFAYFNDLYVVNLK